MRRKTDLFSFFFTCWFTVYGPGVRANRERILISSHEDKKLVYYNRNVDKNYYGDQIIKNATKSSKIL